MTGVLKVEFVFRFDRKDEVPKWYAELFKDYKVFESDGRFVVDVPLDWNGFKDGTVVKILKELNESVYVALAYLTEDEDELVTDFDGASVDRFQEVVEGRKCSKFVKKRLRILRIVNADTGTFTVKGFVLNLKYSEPVIKVLDVYSVGKESNLVATYFIGEK